MKRSQNLYKYFVQTLNLKNPSTIAFRYVFKTHRKKNYPCQKTLQSVEHKMSEIQIQNNYD